MYPIIGANKQKYLNDAAGALDVKLSDVNAACLEELYEPCKVVSTI